MRHGALITVALLMLPLPAAAQSSAADRIAAIERQVRSLQEEVKRLKRELATARRSPEASHEAQAQSVAVASPERAAVLPTQRAAAIPASGSPPAPPTMVVTDAPPGPHVTQSAKNRFGLESADGRSAIPLRLGPGSQQRRQCAACAAQCHRQVRRRLELHLHLRFRRLVRWVLDIGRSAQRYPERVHHL